MAFKTIKERLRRRRLRSNAVDIEVRPATVTYGARSGAWTICPDGIGKGSVVYSFGVGKNISWDLAMIEAHGVELHAFDPTPRSIRWLSGQSLPPSFHFHAYGLLDRDGRVELCAPPREHKTNYTARGAKRSVGEAVSFPVKRLSTILRELGHERLDILKMDIEGSEMAAIPDILDAGIPIRQWLVEFHYNYPGISFDDTIEIVRRLRAAGYAIFHISSRGYEFSFLKAESAPEGGR